MSRGDVEPHRFEFDADVGKRLTHYAFRYPAKFHPPVVRELIKRYSKPGQICFDPFCGSGTLLVEAVAAGRHAIGSDVDPLAVFVSRAKTIRHDVAALAEVIRPVIDAITDVALQHPQQSCFRLRDIDEETFNEVKASEGIWLPEIPNLHHWFRRVVLLQLARMKRIIDDAELPEDARTFLRLCFASIIRNSSNADPTPVSGLEVTSHMKQREAAGRSIDPFELLMRTISRNLKGAEQYASATRYAQASADAIQADARDLGELGLSADAIITSPPYHNAVDYYRRHQLEMYWLGLVANQDDRLRLLRRYMGRANVAKQYFLTAPAELPTVCRHWEAKMRSIAPRRADDFLQYLVSMSASFEQFAGVLPPGGEAIFVVGNSRFAGEEIPTTDVLSEAASPFFRRIETLWYPVKNRYMSYERRNGANINREYVLVFEKAS